MRLPLRVVGDYHVDRLEVYAQQCVQLTSTNRPKAFLSKTEPKLSLSEKYCGGYSSVDPPLPIPNREVKHTNADGTAPPGGRVGRCRFSDARLSFQPGVFVFAQHERALTGASPQTALIVGRLQPKARVSIVRWNLKEAGGKRLAR